MELCLCWRSSGAEQLPCKQWVGGSNPPASASFEDVFRGSRGFHRMPAGSGRYPSGQRGQTVNLLAYAFGGSNPPLPTIVATGGCSDRSVGGLFEVRGAPTGNCGNSSAVERQPSKLGVAGSNPVSRSRCSGADRVVAPAPRRVQVTGRFGSTTTGAHVAQSVEHVLGKDGVTGSSPVMGSSLLPGATPR